MLARLQLTGLATGIFLLLVVCLMSVFSLHLLVQAAEYLGVGANTSFRGEARGGVHAPPQPRHISSYGH